MKLFYYETRSPHKNFGDELNPWLWHQLLPELDSCPNNVFVGIGTLLNESTTKLVSEAKNVIFFSTGVGYGKSLRFRPPPNWKIYCVRGPLSAKRLNLPNSLAITDGAALLKRYFNPVSESERRYACSYMPHFRHGSRDLFKAVCERAGIHYIDPVGKIEAVISDISQSKVLISEAMHGAIVADTFRVPWIPVRTSPKILPFKWRDWCASVQQPYRYYLIKGVKCVSREDLQYPVRPFLQGQSSAIELFDGLRMSNAVLTSRRPSGKITEETMDRLSLQLISITQKTPFLSSDRTLETLVVRLEERLDKLKQDIS
ncbi:MAG: polysaccharide pyruvyl transferase family protein [Cyanobacteria bacterium P01_D01_bin.1]